MKRIASIQDLSCVGKCSQGIALPVLSAMGIECAALPTALLSAHTVFKGFRSLDLSPYLPAILAHWKALGLRFDAIYSGFLGSVELISLMEQIYRDFGSPNTLRFVDPVMADHGALYAGIPADFPAAMGRLCRQADIITPNVTEACLLTGRPYREEHSEGYVRELLEALLGLGVQTAIITGLRTDTRHMGVATMHRDGSFRLHLTDYVPAVFHGTGDLFASTCVGALVLGRDPGEAIALAADHVNKTIHVTRQDPSARWYGVNFEETLSDLAALAAPTKEAKL